VSLAKVGGVIYSAVFVSVRKKVNSGTGGLLWPWDWLPLSPDLSFLFNRSLSVIFA
jgi:hypothetical protein